MNLNYVYSLSELFASWCSQKTMATVGVLPEFDQKNVSWEELCELLEHYVYMLTTLTMKELTKVFC